MEFCESATWLPRWRPQKILSILGLALFFTAGLAAQGIDQTSDLAICLRKALITDPRMRELGLSARELAAQGQFWAADHGPQFSLAGSPLAGVNQASVAGVSAQFGLGASFSQKLPGEGSLQASLGHTMTMFTDGKQAVFDQSPSLSIGLSQPLLVNGKLIDTGLTDANRNLQVVLPAQRLTARQVATANAVTIELVKTWYELGLMEATLRMQDARIAWGAKNREILITRQNLGQIAPGEAGKADLDLGRLRSSRIENDWNRRQLLERLAVMSGRQEWTGVDFSGPMPVLAVPSAELGTEEVAAMAKEVVDAEADLAEARSGLVLAGKDHVPGLGLRFSLAPKSAGAPSDLATSFSNLGANGASLNPTLGLELSLPVWDGGRAQAAKELAATRVVAATERRDRARESAIRRLDGVLGRLDMARQKIALYAGNLEWQDQQLAIVRTQAQLGNALDMDLIQAQANRDESFVEQRRAELDYLATCLELFDICGRSVARELGLTAGSDTMQP